MSLLMYDDIEQSPMKDLARVELRRDLANQVNQVILQSHGYRADLKLGFYWQMLQWSQD